MSGFRITGGKGFHITFKNDVTVSVQFGKHSYSDNKNEDTPPGEAECNNAEIALWGKSGEWITKECFKQLWDEDLHDDVVGFIEPEKLVDVINWAVAHAPTD